MGLDGPIFVMHIVMVTKEIAMPTMPLPWIVHKSFHKVRPHQISDEGGDEVAMAIDKDDAEFIVLAANSHDKLVGMLAKFVAAETRMGGNNPIAGLADEARVLLAKLGA